MKHKIRTMFILRMICIFSLLLLVCYLNKSKKTSLYSVTNDIYLDNSKIHGTGVFAGKHYNKGDVIVPSLFPHNKSKEQLYHPISKQKFQDYILNYGRYFNHCSTNYNTYIYSDDYIIFKLIATKDIPNGTEITANYDDINNTYPFIATSKKDYSKC